MVSGRSKTNSLELGCKFMTPQIDIEHMSRAEKLRMMEALWEDLSRDDSATRSPDWHQQALRETEESVAAGQESLLDWEHAKKELRKKFE